MTLIQSISGFRGTIGGYPGQGLTPVDVVKFTSSYGMWLRSKHPGEELIVVLGRDARVSGGIINSLVSATLQSMGINIVDAGLSTTPTVAMGVCFHGATGGIIITASHNPKNWNALKFFNEKGELLNATQAAELEALMDFSSFDFASVDRLGKYSFDEGMLETHIEKILALPLVDKQAIHDAHFTVVVDAVNSSGGVAVPLLLETLGVHKVVKLHCEPNGAFPHNPEPLPENLLELCQMVPKESAHVGFAVDPDVDRLAIVDEQGECFGEEYTLVAVADYVLSQSPGNAVSNLSSTQALQEIVVKYGKEYHASAVGEVNVVETMKLNQAVIGGEGNGGVIYPALHYGRDALVGIALFLSHLARSGKTCSMLKKRYPQYYMTKSKVELPHDADIQMIMNRLSSRYGSQPKNTDDGIKIWFDREWVHLRCSNTEPIIRIYTESDDMVKAENLSEKIKLDIGEILVGEQD